MADKTWVGGTSGVVSVAANWSGGAVPGVGDNCWWNSTTTYPPSSGTFDNDIATFTATEQANSAAANGGATFGSQASPIDFANNVPMTSLRLANRGNAYFTNTSGTITTVTLEMPNGFTGVISGGTITNLVVVNCKADVGASAVLTNIYSLGGTGTVATNATDVTLWEGIGHWTFNSRDVDTANIELGGTVLLAGTSAADTQINISRGGVFSHQSSGTVAVANIRPGGTYTVKGNTSTAATLTSAIIWSGGTLIESAEGFTLTVSGRTYRGAQTGIGPVS